MHTIQGLIAGLTLMSAAALASALATERPVLPVQLVPMPPEPIETLLHDLDGDGALDALVLSEDGSRVTVLRGTGDGGLDPVPLGSVITPSLPVAMDLGDVDGDLIPDLVIAGNNQVSLFLGNGNAGIGDGSFGTEIVLFPAINDATDVVLHDLDDDGALDLVITRNSVHNVGAWLGDGAGNFGTPWERPTGGTSPSNVVVGDLDGDQVPDLVIRNEFSRNLSVMIGNGAGGFMLDALLDTVEVPRDLDLGDLDGNGTQDLVVTRVVFPDPVVYWLGVGDGSFGPRTAFTPSNLDRGENLALGDLEGDGDLDLVFEAQSPDGLQVLRQEAGFTFPTVESLEMSPSSAPLIDGISLGDLDGDGQLDIVATAPEPTSSTTAVVGVVLGDGAGGYPQLQPYPIPFYVGGMAIGDVDNDGLVDVGVMTRKTPFVDSSVWILQGDGTGGLDTPVETVVPTNADGSPLGITFARFDNDNLLDAVVLDSTGDRVLFLPGQGDGTFGAQVPAFPYFDPTDIVSADLDRDGNADVICVHEPWDKLSVLLGHGDGTFAGPGTHDVGLGPEDVALGDLDGDGILDAVTANSDSDDISVLIGNGVGGFAAAVNYPVVDNPESVALGDLDGDGVLDVVVGNRDNFVPNVSVFGGLGDGTLTLAAHHPAGLQVQDVALADMDDDGHLDVVASMSPGSCAVLFGSGDLGLSAPWHFQGRADSYLFLTDLDGDFAPDVLQGRTGVDILLNRKPTAWTNLRGGVAGFRGVPALTPKGSLVGGEALSLTLEHAQPFATMLAWLSFSSLPTAYFGGTIHAFPPNSQFLRFADGDGTWSQSLVWPVGLPSDIELWLQFLVQDFSTVHGITLSNAVTAVTP